VCEVVYYMPSERRAAFALRANDCDESCVADAGVVDDATIHKMQTPRCGVMDPPAIIAEAFSKIHSRCYTCIDGVGVQDSKTKIR